VINPFAAIRQYGGEIATLEAELRAGLERFWQTAATVLDGGPIRLTPPDQLTLSLPRNFFSTLFLYSYHRLKIPAKQRILYVAVNQCLRAMVTGCDNLLDDEYKPTLETDLPAQAHRFRSVLDIMVSDRVLFALLVAHCQDNDLPVDLALRASTASLQALTRSGAQEAAEEGGINERLAPEVILRTIHHYKTGLLFQATWVIPTLFMETISPEVLAVQEALYTIGIGCQLLDDIVDLMLDLREHRHNYVASVIAHRQPTLWQPLLDLEANGANADLFYAQFPDFATRISTEALTTLENGLRALFAANHQDLVRPAAAFIADRIGVVPPRR